MYNKKGIISREKRIKFKWKRSKKMTKFDRRKTPYSVREIVF